MRKPQRELPLHKTGDGEVLGRLPLDRSSYLTAKKGKWSPEKEKSTDPRSSRNAADPRDGAPPSFLFKPVWDGT